MDKGIRHPKSWKMKENKKHPYKSRLPKNVHQTEDFFIVDEAWNILEKFRLKATACIKAECWKKNYGRRVKVVTSDEYKEQQKNETFIKRL